MGSLYRKGGSPKREVVQVPPKKSTKISLLGPETARWVEVFCAKVWWSKSSFPPSKSASLGFEGMGVFKKFVLIYRSLVHMSMEFLSAEFGPPHPPESKNPKWWQQTASQQSSTRHGNSVSTACALRALKPNGEENSASIE